MIEHWRKVHSRRARMARLDHGHAEHLEDERTRREIGDGDNDQVWTGVEI